MTKLCQYLDEIVGVVGFVTVVPVFVAAAVADVVMECLL